MSGNVDDVRVVCFGDIGLAESTQHLSPEHIEESARLPQRGKWNRKVLSPWAKAFEKEKEQKARRDKLDGKFFIEEPAEFSLTQPGTEIRQSLEEHVHNYSSTKFNITKICCQYNHTLMLMLIYVDDGTLYGFGNGSFGKLGNEGTHDESVPFRVLDEVVDMATGLNHSVAVRADGSVLSWGSSSCGQLGHGSLDDVWLPKHIAHFMYKNEKPVKVACGDYHTMVLCDSGLIYGFGKTTEGQLDKPMPDTHESLPDVPSSEDESARTSSQLLYQCTPKLMKCFEKIPHKNRLLEHYKARRRFIKFVHVDCGQNFTAALSVAGDLYMCGEGRTGVLCRGTTHVANHKVKIAQFTELDQVNSRVIDVQCVLKNGQELTPELTFSLTSQIVQPPTHNKKFVQIVCGWGHVMCLADDQTIYSCGLNLNGQCGTGDKSKVVKLTQVKQPKQLREEGVASISCGGAFSIITSKLGKSFLLGRFPFSNLDFVEPTHVPELSLDDIHYLRCGYRKVVCIQNI
ncbi:hypothetical protein AKO1_013128 [Acrasis kona]|uniref:Uncharacterized protein n=1 Tax=Acrasis kona TaxID=1008807 RepID=A0AAW2ZI80_9EUKA